jgi:hypothetical protein
LTHGKGVLFLLEMESMLSEDITHETRTKQYDK